MSNEIWIDIEGFPDYEFSNTGKMRNKKTGYYLKLSRGRNYVIRNEKGNKTFPVNTLITKYFTNDLDDLPNEEWRQIEDYDNYEISNYKRVRNKSTGRIIKQTSRITLDKQFYVIKEYEKAFPELLDDKEEWRYIENSDNYYISNYGNVKNTKTGRVLKHGINNDGYHFVRYKMNDGKFTIKYVARLVAIAFIPNPNNLPEINHKDENKDNNCVDNLEWCDRKYNINYGTAKERRAKTMANKNYNTYRTSKAVLQYDKEGKLIKRYNSLKEAQEQFNSKSSGYICRAINGIYKTAYGFIWKYENE